MGLPHTVALGALLSLSVGGASGSWQWQRTITPPPAAPAAEQCVVLDADLYIHAAPGLRDVRLVQDGREIAYALEESYDASAQPGRSPGGRLTDRSLYTTVLRLSLSAVGLTDKAGTMQHGEGVLLRQVPVERMELVPVHTQAPRQETPIHPAPVRFRLVATPVRQGQDSEVIEDVLDVGRPMETTAVGANLQDNAKITVTVSGAVPGFSEVLLQMHQRSLCYQPLSRAPLTLFFGNRDARPVHYDYALHYTPTATPLLATMAPMQRNPMYRPHTAEAFLVTRTQRTLIACVVALGAFLLTAVPLLRRR